MKITRSRILCSSDNLKYYECLVTYRTGNSGTQTAYAYCFATSKTDAKRIIRNSIPYKDVSVDVKNVYSTSAYKNKSKDSVELWYYDENEKEQRESFPVSNSVVASSKCRKLYVSASEDVHDNQFWIDLIYDKWDSLKDDIVAVMKDANGRPQQDLYLYPDGTTSVFWNPGGNSWEDSDSIVIYSTRGQEYYSDLDNIETSDIVEMFADYDNSIYNYLEQLRVERDCDTIDELYHEIDLEKELINYNQDAYDKMMDDMWNESISEAYEGAEYALESTINELEDRDRYGY